MHPKCELAVKEILPAVRSIVSQYYMEKGLKQEEIANALELTQPVVSKYLRANHGKNAQILKQDNIILAQIKDLAEQILHGNKNSDQFCVICEAVRRKKLICDKCINYPMCKLAVCTCQHTGAVRGYG